MNALTSIRADENIHGTVTQRAYRHTINTLCPGCEELNMAARVDIAMMRDAAMVGVERASEQAATMLYEVVKLATQAVYAPLPTSRLLRIRAACSFIMEAARTVDLVLRDG